MHEEIVAEKVVNEGYEGNKDGVSSELVKESKKV